MKTKESLRAKAAKPAIALPLDYENMDHDGPTNKRFSIREQPAYRILIDSVPSINIPKFTL